MHFSTLFLTTLLSTALAAPLAPRADSIDITFKGAADAQYSLTVPLDGEWHDTPNPADLNISKLRSTADILLRCKFHTYDPPAVAAKAAFAVSADDGAVDVGPPQPILKVACK